MKEILSSTNTGLKLVVVEIGTSPIIDRESVLVFKTPLEVFAEGGKEKSCG